MVRYRREEEVIADALKATRRVAREASRPTGTEISLTTQVAEQAASDAASAVVAANGKNRVWFTNSPPPGTDHQLGDTWFDGSSGNRINEWDGSDWVAKPFGDDAIEDLAITNAKIANLDAAKIVSGSFEGKSFTGGTFTGSIFQTAVSGQRMKFDVNGLSAYNSSGTRTLSLSSVGNGFSMTEDANNSITFSTYTGIRYQSTHSGYSGVGRFTLEPKLLWMLNGSNDAIDPGFEIDHTTDSGDNPVVGMRVRNAKFSIQTDGDASFSSGGGGDLHLGFNKLTTTRVEAFTAQLYQIDVPQKIKFGFTSDAESDVPLIETSGFGRLRIRAGTAPENNGGGSGGNHIDIVGNSITLDGRTTTPGNTFANKAALDLWTNAIPGTRAWVTDTGFEYIFLTGAWKLYATNGEIDITSQLLPAYRGQMSYAVAARILTLNVNAAGSLPTGQTIVGTLAADLCPSGLKAGAVRLSSDYTGTLLVNAAGAVVPSHQSGATRTAATGFVSYGLS